MKMPFCARSSRVEERLRGHQFGKQVKVRFLLKKSEAHHRVGSGMVDYY